MDICSAQVIDVYATQSELTAEGVVDVAVVALTLTVLTAGGGALVTSWVRLTSDGGVVVCCVGCVSTVVAVVAPRGGNGGDSVTFLGTSDSPVLLNASIVSSMDGAASGDTLLLTQ